ncbi:ATP-dependent metallopeptidase FtsH/Yme1/Tma family protein, partial [Oceanidesulfovibrio indonesiensis]|uniref:ATP-dependent metallopeptidase FtsH/Yme1/Tma family protein n=1 Tax=Oceanidesulfovibrio indonesiensis TaxID=54767 RepID=UPI001F22BBAB
VALFNMFQQPQSMSSELTYSEFMQRVETGDVSQVPIQGKRITGELASGETFVSYAPEDPQLVEKFMGRNIRVTDKPPEDQSWFLPLLVFWFPMLLLIGMWIFLLRQMQGGGGSALSFVRSKASLVTQESANVTLADVAGVDDAKQ